MLNMSPVKEKLAQLDALLLELETKLTDLEQQMEDDNLE